MLPRHLSPMLATAGRLPPEDGRWSYEVKWDGVRALVFVEGAAVSVQSRVGNDVTASYPELQAVRCRESAVLDGEVVAFDAAGRPDFGLLQSRMHVGGPSAALRARTPVALLLFDVLHVGDRSLLAEPYERRRALLAELAPTGAQVPAAFEGDGAALLASTLEQGLEGVVAKRLDSRYEPGRRSDCWVKVKNVRRQSAVVIGWKPGEGGRAGSVGSLLLAVQDGGALAYAGHVGTGFNAAALDLLRGLLAGLAVDTAPCEVAREYARRARWVRPSLVVEVEYTAWTREGRLRHPSYKGLRDDLDPGQVVRDVKVTVEVEGRQLVLSNLDKVLYPEVGFTKGQVLDYYSRIAPVLLPHLADRPLTLKRYPDGVQGHSFYEKNAPSYRPEWLRVETIATPGSTKQRETIDFAVLDDLPSLMWVANLACLELHVPQWTVGGGDPDLLVLDLDPGPPATVVECCRVALLIREQLAPLEVFAKTSGSKGMQLAARAPQADTSSYAKDLAQSLERAHPALVLHRMTKALRPGKVLVDWSQNSTAKTTVCVYSLRARPRPTVSTPVTWAEVEACRSPQDLVFTTDEVLDRVAAAGDLWAPLAP